MKTEMKDIPGWENEYSVTSDGRVWSKKRIVKRKRGASFTVGGKWIKAKTNATGYFFVGLNRNGKIKNMKVHRLVAFAFLGVKDMDVDHINRDRSDNRLENLRYATRSQNLANKRKREGSSRFKGVCWNKRVKRWFVRIGKNGKTSNLGYFKSEIDAARAYNKAARDLFGEFATLNPV